MTPIDVLREIVTARPGRFEVRFQAYRWTPGGGTATVKCLVDPMWVGWQLERDFAVLRVTANTKRWNVLPQRIENPIPKGIK